MSKKKRRKPHKKKSSDKRPTDNVALITAILSLIRVTIELINHLLEMMNKD